MISRTYTISLVIIIILFASACSTVFPNSSSTSDFFASQSPTSTSTMTPSPAPENITNALSVQSENPFVIQITNNSMSTLLTVYRRLANEYQFVCDLKPGEFYDDHVAWDGTEYYYWGENSKGEKTNEIGIITAVSEATLQRGLFYHWDDLAKQRGIPSVFRNIDPTSSVFEYKVHGVTIKMIFEEACADKLTENMMKGYFNSAVTTFDKNWQMYEGFPLDEYRIFCFKTVPNSADGIYESDLGMIVDLETFLFQIDTILSGDTSGIGHGMGHAWMGSNILGFINNGWIWEGFDSYNSIITIKSSRNQYFKGVIANAMMAPHFSEPLNSMYNNSEYGAALYTKGEIFAHKVSIMLHVETNKDYKGFMKYLYDKYYLTQNHQGQQYFQTGIQISTSMFAKDLTEFSGIDFSELFSAYADGRENILAGLQIEEEYFPSFYSADGSEFTSENTKLIILPDDRPTPMVIPNTTFEPLVTKDAMSQISPKDGMILLYVPEGNFIMGDNRGGHPELSVYLDAYWIDQTEVTNKMYEKCVSEGACTQPSNLSSTIRNEYYGNPDYDDYPVIYVNWFQAETYCKWAGRMLPTVAEWEKAASGTDGRLYPWSDVEKQFYDDLVNAENFYADTTRVGSFPKGASPYGVLDMLGNVQEWVEDYYDVDYWKGGDLNNPLGAPNGDYRSIRSSSWKDAKWANYNRSERSYPSLSYPNVGFRCAVESKNTVRPTATIINTPTPGPTPEVKVATTDRKEMVRVPSGNFTMGPFNQWPIDGEVIEYTDPFWIDRTEVSNADYSKCVNDGVCTEPTDNTSRTREWYYGNPVYDDYPVIYVSFEQANDYCNWAGKRLPTAKEWEKAARGFDGPTYPWGRYIYKTELANYNNLYGDTTPVDSYANSPSPFGTINMAGNVWEWVSAYQIATSADILPPRGGAFDVSNIRVYSKREVPGTAGADDTGFRCVMDPDNITWPTPTP